MLSRHRDAVEADLLRYYRVDLADLYRGGLSIRRLYVLMTNAPADSAYRRSVLGADEAAWGVTEHLLATVVDALQVANWQRSKDGARGRGAPKPIPRPTDAPRPRIGGTNRPPADARRMLARLAGRGGETREK